MDERQKINCNVGSCEYNDPEDHKCELDEIVVEPCKDCGTGEPEEESMCGSYIQTWED
ncbi:MAG: DUF1540 domain-containing protein [Oscillospiraceae bacterium]|nr:DUF1540 domain-containing protein [Oscillospiraceae bacterium]